MNKEQRPTTLAEKKNQLKPKACCDQRDPKMNL